MHHIRVLKQDLHFRNFKRSDLENLKNKSGVYAIYLNGECLYVGATKCLRERVWIAVNHSDNIYLNLVLKHFPYNKTIDAYIFYCSKEELHEREKEIIHRLLPRFNHINRPYNSNSKDISNINDLSNKLLNSLAEAIYITREIKKVN